MNADIKLSKIKEKWKKQCEQRMTTRSEHQKRKRNRKTQHSQMKNVYFESKIYRKKRSERERERRSEMAEKNWRERSSKMKTSKMQ